jgi:hypothetical protein
MFVPARDEPEIDRKGALIIRVDVDVLSRRPPGEGADEG